jgi:quinol monooxygenase YgiN
MSNVVSIHPYFKTHPGKLDEFKANLAEFCQRTATEPLCHCYDFTISGDVVHCREAYDGADGLLAHLDNVGEMLAQALKISDLIRVEIHGPAAELEKLKEPLGHLNADYFKFHSGIGRP